jgi:hypothetical protein
MSVQVQPTIERSELKRRVREFVVANLYGEMAPTEILAFLANLAGECIATYPEELMPTLSSEILRINLEIGRNFRNRATIVAV